MAKPQQVIPLWSTALRPEETHLSLRMRVSCCGQGSRLREHNVCLLGWREKAGMVAPAFNPSIQEAEAGRSL